MRLLHRLIEHGADGAMVFTFEKRKSGVVVEVVARFPNLCPVHDDVPRLLREATQRMKADLDENDPCSQKTVH